MSSQPNSAFSDIKSAAKGIQGAGDAIRGTFNESVDHAFHEREGEAENKAIADKGLHNMENTDQHFGAKHGIQGGTTTTPTATAAGSERGTGLKTGGLGDGTTSRQSTTSAGTHAAPAGNLESQPVEQSALGSEPEPVKQGC